MVTKKSFLCVLFLVFLFFVVCFIDYLNQTSTNIPDLITHSLSKTENKPVDVEIFETIAFSDDQLVCYTYDGKLGYSIIIQDEFSRYQIKTQKRQEQCIQRGHAICIDYLNLVDEQQEQKPYFMVLSKNPALSSIKFQLNNQDPIYKEVHANPSLSLIPVPSEPYCAEYLFFDQSGDLIPDY